MAALEQAYRKLLRPGPLHLRLSPTRGAAISELPLSGTESDRLKFRNGSETDNRRRIESCKRVQCLLTFCLWLCNTKPWVKRFFQTRLAHIYLDHIFVTKD